MQCGDLDRFLETFLDGQLDRAGSLALRHHVMHCGACQARVERLRQFERDTQRRFRALERSGSVWQGLELDLVASSRATAVNRLLALPRDVPPPRRSSHVQRPAVARRTPGHPMLAMGPTARGHASRVVGILLLAMALGTLYEFGHAYLAPADELAAAYRQFLRDDQPSALRSTDAQRVQTWLASELALEVTIPAAPAGFQLVGADRVALGGGEAGVLVYDAIADSSEAPVLLFVRSATRTAPARSADRELSQLSWETTDVRYTLVGREPTDALEQFVH